MPNNHTDEYRADTTEKRILTQKCCQTITNSWERAIGCIGWACHARDMFNFTAVRLADNDTNENSASPDNNLAVTQQNNRSEVKCLDIPMVLAKKRRNTIATQNTNITTAIRVWSLEIKQREKLQALANSTMIPHRVCKCASFQRNLWKTTFPQLMLPASLKKHSGNVFNFAWMANNLGGHQPYPQQHHPAKMHLNAQENRAVFGKTFTHSHSPSDCRRRGNNIVPNFDPALATTIGTLQSTNNSDKLFGSKSSARQLTTGILHQMFGKLCTRAYSAHVEQPYPRIPRRQTITNSWERATRTRDQQRCNCLHGMGMPCSRNVQFHRGPLGRQ